MPAELARGHTASWLSLLSRDDTTNNSNRSHNGTIAFRYCVQWKSLYPLLRTMEISISVTAYNRHPYIRYSVQRKSLYPLLRTIGLLMKIHIPKIPGSPAAAAKISNQNAFLRTMEIPFSVTAYNGNPYFRDCVPLKSLYPLLRTMEIAFSVVAYNGNPYIRFCVQLGC